MANKGGNDLYDRIFCKSDENRFKNIKETYYGKLISRYCISEKTDELFNLDFKKVLNKNESVSFTQEAFDKDKKILWRQTASSIIAILDTKKRWFRNTIQCAWVRGEFKNRLDMYYALAIFNSNYIKYIYKQKVLESGRVFPQVKIKYLKDLPFVVAAKEQQSSLSEKVKKILELNKELQKAGENSNKYNSIKSEIEKTDKKIDEEVYKLYGLTEGEIKIIENA